MNLKARNRATRVRDHWTRVFISHKEEDKELAFAVRTVLESGSGSLRCFVSGSDYSGDWLATIRSELRSADVLLLLFTSPARQWDWPLYEVGLFTPIEETAPQGAIVYLYSGESRPKPLEHLQGVRAHPGGRGRPRLQPAPARDALPDRGDQPLLRRTREAWPCITGKSAP